MLTLSFNKSKSSKLHEAMKFATAFSGFQDNENSIDVAFSIKEVFEKWDFFNNLFWIVIDWKDTTLSYDNMAYHSHTDKTRIFYALQDSHWKWIAYVEMKISKLCNIKNGITNLSDLNIPDNIDDKTVDMLIDMHTIIKNKQS